MAVWLSTAWYLWGPIVLLQLYLQTAMDFAIKLTSSVNGLMISFSAAPGRLGGRRASLQRDAAG